MRKFWLVNTLLVLSALFCTQAFATCTGTSPTWTSTIDQTSVLACISSASNGDTINVGAGTATWTAVTWGGKDLSLIGAGSANSIITCASGGCAGFDESTGGSRISGFTFNEGSGDYLQITGSAGWRLDHNTIARTFWDIGILMYGEFTAGTYFPEEGLIDDNKITYSRIDFQGEDTSRGGRDAWALPMRMGTSHAVYVEDNNLLLPDGSTITGASVFGNTTDCNLGGRMVVRFNTMVGGRFEHHGLQGENQDGCMLFEYYNNTMTNTNINITNATCSAGTVTLTLASPAAAAGFELNASMLVSGVNPSGYNTGAGITTPVTNVSGNTVQYSASCPGTYVSGGSAQLPNFRPFLIRGGSGLIFHNTSDGLFLNNGLYIDSDRANEDSIASQVPNWQFCDGTLRSTYLTVPGNLGGGTTTYPANKTILIDGAGTGGYPCRDQLGTATNTGGALWDYTTTPPTQTLQPAYFWRNTQPGGEIPVTVSCETPGDTLCTNQNANILLQNRDFYTYNASFNGTSGIGEGTLASRPSTCTTGVGYWATDQGNWNQSGNGAGQGEFFQCSSTNTWTLFYQPYTYPNPLQGTITPTSAPAPQMLAKR